MNVSSPGLSFFGRSSALQKLARVLDETKLLTYSFERSPRLVRLARCDILDSIILDTTGEEANITKLEHIKRAEVAMG